MSVIIKGDYREVLEEKGVLSFTPNGNSMWPFIKNHKQSVVIEKISRPINRLDVLFYIRPDGTYVLHRVVEVCGDGYLMRGDSQVISEKISKESALGIMTSFYKRKKQISVQDKKYQKQVEKWYRDGAITRLKKKVFNFMGKVKNKLSRNKNKENQND